MHILEGKEGWFLMPNDQAGQPNYTLFCFCFCSPLLTRDGLMLGRPVRGHDALWRPLGRGPTLGDCVWPFGGLPTFGGDT